LKEIVFNHILLMLNFPKSHNRKVTTEGETQTCLLSCAKTNCQFSYFKFFLTMHFILSLFSVLLGREHDQFTNLIYLHCYTSPIFSSPWLQNSFILTAFIFLNHPNYNFGYMNEKVCAQGLFLFWAKFCRISNINYCQGDAFRFIHSRKLFRIFFSLVCHTFFVQTYLITLNYPD
jgi:hypothetical protein